MQISWPLAIFLLVFTWLSALTIQLIVIMNRLQKSKLPAHSNLGYTPDFSKFFRYFSLVKYNPFADTGGEQSFILTLLNGEKNGMIITSLHGRGVTRFYAKQINHGLADQELSAEEKHALTQAISTP